MTTAMRMRLTLSCGFLLAMGAAGCATSRLTSLPPAGVNLSGDWVLNANLSDDSESLDALDKIGKKKKKDKPSGDGSGDAATDIASASAANRVPQRMSIQQDGAKVVFQAGDPPEPKEFTTTEKAPCGNDDRCNAGWRGPVFVVDTHPKGSKAREETYALDSEGHLILTIQNGDVYAKVAYDRVKS
jgi:hypothetical protein